jgi:hypothetical protein
VKGVLVQPDKPLEKSLFVTKFDCVLFMICAFHSVELSGPFDGTSAPCSDQSGRCSKSLPRGIPSAVGRNCFYWFPRFLSDVRISDDKLLADDAQVVGRFEVGNPVVEETDTVRPAKAIQFVEPDRPLAQPLSEVLEEKLEPAWSVQLDDACRLGARVPHGVGDAARLQHPAAGCRLDDLLADPSVHLPLEHVEPDIVLVHVWRQEKTRLEWLLDDRDGPVRLFALKLDDDAVGDVTLVRGDQRLALDAFTHNSSP